MKKLLLVTILGISALTFADTKSDYENAVKLAGEKKIEEAIKTLEKVGKSGDKVYEVKANYNLGVYYYQKDELENAKKYLEAVWKEQGTITEETEGAAQLLYLINYQNKNLLEAEKYIVWADKNAKGKDADILSSLLIFYNDTNQIVKAKVRYDELLKTNDKELIAEISYDLGQYYYNRENISEAKKYLETSYKTSENAVIPAGILLSRISYDEKDNAKAEKYLVDINTKTGGKNSEVLGLLGSFYLIIGNEAKSIDFFEKATAVNKEDVDARIALIDIYESKKDVAKVEKIYNELKTIIPLKDLNLQLGVLFARTGSFDVSEKYLKKSINEDKVNDGKIVLGQIYIQKGKNKEGIALLKEAVENKVPNAEEFLKEAEKNNK